MRIGLKIWVTMLFNKGDHIGSPVPYVNFCSIVEIKDSGVLYKIMKQLFL